MIKMTNLKYPGNSFEEQVEIVGECASSGVVRNQARMYTCAPRKASVGVSLDKHSGNLNSLEI